VEEERGHEKEREEWELGEERDGKRKEIDVYGLHSWDSTVKKGCLSPNSGTGTTKSPHVHVIIMYESIRHYVRSPNRHIYGRPQQQRSAGAEIYPG